MMKTGHSLSWFLLPFILWSVCVQVCIAKPAQAGSEMSALIQKSISAHGFPNDELSTLRSWVVVRDANVTIGEREVECRLTISWESTDRRHIKMQFEQDGQSVTVTSIYDGKIGRGWNSYNGRTVEMSQEELEESKHSVHANSLIGLVHLLDSSRYQLSTGGRIEIDGRRSIGVKVSRKGFREAVIFFDEKTFLVVKLLYVIKDTPADGKPKLFESFFSDFKKTGGRTVHSSFRSVHGAKTIAHGKTLEMIISKQALRANTFAMP